MKDFYDIDDWMTFHSFDAEEGRFYPAGADYPSMMNKQITKHDNKLQPIFEALTNSFEALTGKDNGIRLKISFSTTLASDQRDFNSILVSDTGHGITDEDLSRIETLFDSSKGFNNFGSGRIQYLHFFEHTDIHSIYEKNGTKYIRHLILSENYYKLHKSVLWEGEPQKIDNEVPTGTTIGFFALRKKDDLKFYNSISAKKMRKEVYDRYLGRMCLQGTNCPSIFFEEYMNLNHNPDADEHIDKDDIPSSEKRFTFTAPYRKLSNNGTLDATDKKESFIINSFKLPLSTLNKNEVKIISKGEVTPANGLSFPFIEQAPTIDDCFRLFLISSNFFSIKDTDKRGVLKLVNAEQLRKEKSVFNLNPEDIIIEDIQEKATDRISHNYVRIKESSELAEANIERLVQLYSLDEKKVRKIASKPNATNLEVFTEVYTEEAQTKATKYNKLNDIMNSLADLNPREKDFEKQFEAKIKKVATLVPEINRLELLNYVTKRKAVLKLFGDIIQKGLQIQKEDQGNHHDDSETLIHRLLFPKKSTDVLSSNIWIINEDFIHFEGVSDTQFKKMKFRGQDFFRKDLTKEEEERLNSFKQKRLTHKPDILLFPAERKCIIIELKGVEIPVSKYIDQVFTYASLIREFADEQFLIDEFYCYLIGQDFSYDDVKRADKNFSYDFTKKYMIYESNEGIYGGEKRGDAKCRFVICRYSDLLERAKLRNKIFTDKISTEHNSDGNYMQ